jgi:Protein of unknown function (DUF1553)/Protein of unknown function (DUF1549)/Planctomycete cytochrome C
MTFLRRTRLLLHRALLAVVASGLSSLERSRGDETVPRLERDVMPILKARCLKCHSPLVSKGKLNLSSVRSLARGGKNGPVIVPGKLDESTLWEQISENEMPPEPEEPLSADEKGLLRRWIEQGAKSLPASAEVRTASPLTDHWAFAPLVTPEAPRVNNERRVRTPVDRFIEKALEAQGLTLGPDADRATLIRRVTFDLTGLPPRPEEIAAFARDTDSGAYEDLVDRLLASPHHGERWGKFWLDASGYADSNGYFSADTDRPLAYRYRDYVIRSVNADRSLDQVVREQLAGDELAGQRTTDDASPATIEQLIATHFLRNGQDGTGESDGNQDEVRADKYAVLDGAIQIMGSSLFGLTLQCARCHDHKFEPVTQREYYQLQAILFPAFNVEHWVNPNKRIVIAGPRDELRRWRLHERLIDTEIKSLEQIFPGGTDGKKNSDGKKNKDVLKRVIDAAEARRWPNPGRIAWVGDVASSPAEIPVFIRGDLASPGAKVGPGVFAFLTDPDNVYEPKPPVAGGTSTGRRLALARWLTRPGSRPAALLARVLANRIWQHHFGVGLVATSDNLGYTGSLPTHPELLEFLADQLVRSGWSAKALHRLILNSSVYRQSSSAGPDAARLDPDNHLLARYPLRRLDAEAVRDAMLAVTGELDERQGGPYVPTDRNATGEVLVDELAPGAGRRSVYLRQHRTGVTSLLEVFDAPSIVTTCTRRLNSTIPLQSLSLMNSDFVIKRAERFATLLERESAGDIRSRIDRAFLLATGREPDARERDEAARFLDTQPANYPGLAQPECRHRALADFCQMLLASNAFLYVD